MTYFVEDIPDMQGRVAIVTGANAGLGFLSGLLLARRGARIVLACRDEGRGADAVARLLAAAPDAHVESSRLDLTDPMSIARFADDFTRRFDRLDLLLNNGAVVNLEHLQRTPDGHEMHMATNHFGHFALTGRLFSLLLATPDARVVTVSSAGYRQGEIRFDDLDWRTRPYDRIRAYGDSKLANLLFMRGLERRFEDRGATALSVAAHPGLTATERQQSIGVGGALTRWLATPIEKGVRHQLRAATDPTVGGGAFVGPRFGFFGPAVPLTIPKQAADDDLVEALWTCSEEITGLRFGTA